MDKGKGGRKKGKGEEKRGQKGIKRKVEEEKGN